MKIKVKIAIGILSIFCLMLIGLYVSCFIGKSLKEIIIMGSIPIAIAAIFWSINTLTDPKMK